MLAPLGQDLRWAVRHAARRPLFALAVSLTLALCIAAATTAYGVAVAVLWRALPFDDASRLVVVWEEVEREGERHPSRVTGSRHALWRDTSSGLASLSLFGAAGFTLEDQGIATSVRGVRVSANYFDTLGIRPILGRSFTPADETPGRHQVVILSHAFWQERLGGRHAALGETLRLSGRPYTIVGVMPPVTFPAWPINPAIVTLDADSRQFWVPIPRTPELDQSGRAHVFGAIGRLMPGVSAREVVERLNRTSTATTADVHRAQVTPLRDHFVADARIPLLTLAAAALAVLLIACANLAALHVSAFESRRSELALRAALGAGFVRLARQLAFETLLLAGAGAIAGLMLTRAALSIVPGLLPPSIPLLTMPVLDARVAAFAIALALGSSAILIGWPIARLIMSSRLERGVAAPARLPVYRALVVSQISVTVALVAAAGLLAQSLHAVRRQDPGVAIDRVFVADIGLPAPASPSAQQVVSAEERLLGAIASRPQVLGVAAAYDHPLEANWSETPAVIGETTAEDQRTPAELRIVSPGYFETLGVELLDGRTLNARDRLDGPGVAIVNEAFAQAMTGRVLGRRLRSGTPRFMYGAAAPDEFEIVGIVKNERVRGLEVPASPAFYLSTRQFPQTGFSILLRTAGDPAAVGADVRAAIRATDAGITFNHPTSLDAILADQLAARRVTTGVIGSFASGALVLAALGMYALLAALVGSRTREIGVRLAIGASPRLVARQVMGDSLRHAAAGVILGCALAMLSGQLIQSLLVGVSATSPTTLVTVAAMLLTVAVCAALIPARRAARIDPIDALRSD